jgi:hypothetical protein
MRTIEQALAPYTVTKRSKKWKFVTPLPRVLLEAMGEDLVKLLVNAGLIKWK